MSYYGHGGRDSVTTLVEGSVTEARMDAGAWPCWTQLTTALSGSADAGPTALAQCCALGAKNGRAKESVAAHGKMSWSAKPCQIRIFPPMISRRSRQRPRAPRSLARTFSTSRPGNRRLISRLRRAGQKNRCGDNPGMIVPDEGSRCPVSGPRFSRSCGGARSGSGCPDAC